MPFSVQGSTEFVYLITRKVRWGLISREIYNRTHIFFLQVQGPVTWGAGGGGGGGGGGGEEGRVGKFRSGSLRYLRRTHLCILVHEKLLQVTKIPRLTYATYVLHFISSDTKFYDQ